MNGRVLVGLGINCYFDLKADKPYYTPAALEFAISWRVGLGEKKKERISSSAVPTIPAAPAVEEGDTLEGSDAVDGIDTTDNPIENVIE
jgi:hypothetical protein